MSARRRNFIDELMAEHIAMPGFPQLIVTRDEAWRVLTDMGCDQVPRAGQGMRFDTVDYMVMSKRALDEPLSDAELRDRVFAAMREDSC